jgi:hypothetical protein
MGTHFFAGKAPQISGGSQNMEARAAGSASGAGIRAGSGAQKALGAAGKAVFKGPLKGTAAYAPGPKKT